MRQPGWGVGITVTYVTPTPDRAPAAALPYRGRSAQDESSAAEFRFQCGEITVHGSCRLHKIYFQSKRHADCELPSYLRVVNCE